jgi:hypothetical protein
MSERSELLKKVLETWNNSEEGQRYLEWLVEPEAADLDGGAILREAVLDLMEDDEQLRQLRQEKVAPDLEVLYADLLPEDAAEVRKATNGLIEARSQQENSMRNQAKNLREIRRVLRRDRLETLKIVSQILNNTAPDEITAFFKNHESAEEVAAKLAALSRTRTERVDVAAEWRVHSTDDTWTQTIQEIASDPGEDWFDNHREKFDRYYSQQLVGRLDSVVERASNLEPVKLEVKYQAVSSLFQEAHEAYLYGFDTASIALCRTLVDPALRDKLSVAHGKRPSLQAMIEQAKNEKLLDDRERDSAERVRAGGNKIMHDMSNLRSTAQEVLDSTRVVLNKLYGIAESEKPNS